MDRSIIHHHHGLFFDGLAKGIKTSDHQLCIDAALHTERHQLVVGVEESQDIEPLAFGRWNLYGLSYRLPGVRDRGVKGKTGFIIIEQIKDAGALFFLTLPGLFQRLQRPAGCVWI